MDCYAKKEEKRQHSTVLVPYSYYECRIPDLFMNVPMHWHNEFELNYILNGAGEFICGDEKFIVHKGDILVFPPNMLHAAYPSANGNLSYDALVFSPLMLGADSNDRCTNECILPLIDGNIKLNVKITATSNNYNKIAEVTEHIFNCVRGNSAKLDLLIKSELLHLLWLLETSIYNSQTESAKISHSEIIRPALAYMASNYQESISIDSLAALVNLSKSYFMSCFKKAVGVGAIEYISQLRIKAACEALLGTNKTISEISYTCGYNNLSNFNKQFKKSVGCTPQQYRKRYRH